MAGYIPESQFRRILCGGDGFHRMPPGKPEPDIEKGRCIEYVEPKGEILLRPKLMENVSHHRNLDFLPGSNGDSQSS